MTFRSAAWDAFAISSAAPTNPSWRCSRASSSRCEQAIEAVEALRPDLFLLYLPDIFGLDVIPRLRSGGHDCDVMVISAAREADAVRGAVRHGVVD